MVPATSLITLIFVLQAIGQYFLWLYWLQVKEYRFDRIFVFLKSPDGRKELLILSIIFKFLVFIIGFYYNAFLFLYLLEIAMLCFLFSIKILTKGLRRPVFTQRIWRITFVTLFFVCLSWYFTVGDFWLFFVLGEASLLFGPFIGTYFTGFSVKATLEKEKKQAEEKLRRFLPTVIAVTGSYGKTTTKDFITQLLSTKYKTLSTYKNQNTHFGIVRRINSELNKNHKFLVVEVGAYKKGEIKEIAKILRPKVAVISGIEPQHVELFGSLEKLKRAKFEIVESLAEGGSAYFNLTESATEPLMRWSEKERKDVTSFSYGVYGERKFDITAKITGISQEKTDFTITLGKEEKSLRTNIRSRSLIENLACAIAIARSFGVEWKNIEKKCQHLELPEGTLNVFKTADGKIVVDDSYNATPHGFEAALELLEQLPGVKKFVLTTGVIELGREGADVHRKLGRVMDRVCDFVLLRNGEFVSPIKEGMHDPGKVRLFRDPNGMLDFVKREGGEGSIILIEGRLPQVVNFFKGVR